LRCELAEDEIPTHLLLYSHLKKLSEEGLKVRYKLDVRQGHLDLAVLQDLDAKVCNFITDPPLVASKLMKCETCSGIEDEELDKTCAVTLISSRRGSCWQRLEMGEEEQELQQDGVVIIIGYY
jgi:hypothetical protein